MEDADGIRAIDELEELFFLIGDWRGRGKLNFRNGPEEFRSNLTCLKSPDGEAIEIIQFDDNPATERMFYAEHLRVFRNRTTGLFEVLRKGFAFADAGDTLFEMYETMGRDDQGVRITPAPGSDNFVRNDLRIVKEGNDELRIEGSAAAGSDSWTLEYAFLRRSPS